VKKNVLQDEGYDLNRVTDPIYYLDQKKQVYVQLTSDSYASIVQGKIQF
jgi:hypothetical protein